MRLRCTLPAHLIGVLIAAVSPVSHATDAAAGSWGPVIERMQQEYPSNGPGAYVIAAQGEHVLMSHGFGLADVEQGLPLTADSVIRIASLTKQFTAVAALRLIQDGRLSLDDRLEGVLHDCPEIWRPITVRQLLNQTSGVSDDLSALYSSLTNDLTVDQILALYSARALDAAPGATWRYSNLNYWILGKVIETVSGESYADFVVKHVLARGMTRTRYGSHGAIVAGRADGYEADSMGGWINARYFSATLGYSAGGFLSTPADMATWYAALSRGEVISKEMLSMAMTDGRTSSQEPTGYGFGWYLSEFGGVRIAHHGGSTFGFQCYIYWVPARGIFVGVFKNASDERGEPKDDARDLLTAAMVAERM